MELLARLLERRALCLRSMVEISSRYLTELRIGDTEGTQRFNESRKRVFEVVRKLDAEIHPLLPQAQAERAHDLLCRQKEWTDKLRALDASITGEITKIKAEIIGNLQQLGSGRRVISAYRSPESRLETESSGGKLDEEI